MTSPNSRFLIFFVLVFLTLPNFSLASHCTVSQIAIIAGTWENTGTKTSYTVQAQNSNKELCHVTKTLRLSFSSTGGGSFTGQTGNPAQAWISSNSANRNFYYESSGPGSDLITIQAGYGATDSWTTLFTTSQDNSTSVVVDNPEDNTQTATTTEPVITTTTSPSQSSSSGSVSTHYSATPITDFNPIIKFEISAGRNRLGVVGVPLEFRAETTKDYLKNTGIKWSLGDGSVKYGDVITHSYEYPGDYIVVVNASSPEGQAVSRTNVKIIPSEISISKASPNRIEITNNSGNNEVNLFGRALISGSTVFRFPQDTILAAKQKISFSANITNLHPTKPNDVDIIIVGENIRLPDLVVKIEEHRLNKIASIRSEIAVLEQRRLALLPRLLPGKTSSPEVVEAVKENDSSIQQTALVLESVSQPESGKISEWLETIKKFFFRTQR